MEGNEERGQNFTLLLLLLISFILVFVDSLDLYQVINSWNYGLTITSPLFESCIKWELYTKTCFTVFALLGAVSCLILTLFLIIDNNWFAEKVLTTFIYFIYIIFGPYMLGFCIIGFFNWSNVVYTCDKQNFNNKVVSASNVFSLIGSFILSCFMTCMISIYKTVTMYLDSILRKPQGNGVIRKLFWWFVFRNREPIQFVRQSVNNNEDNRNNV